MLKSILLTSSLFVSTLIPATQVNFYNSNLSNINIQRNFEDGHTIFQSHNSEIFHNETQIKIDKLYLREGIETLENGYKLETKVIPILNYFQWFAGAESNLQTSQTFSFAKSLYDDKDKTNVSIIGYEAIASGPIMLDWITQIGFAWFEILNEPLIMTDLNLVATTGVSHKDSKLNLKGVYNIFKGIRGEIRYKNISGKKLHLQKQKVSFVLDYVIQHLRVQLQYKQLIMKNNKEII